MKRRPFLRLAAGAAAATAGCVGRSDVAAVSADGRPAAGDATPMAAGDPDGSSLSISAAETFDHVVRLNDLGGDPAGGVTAFADLSGREREVASAALAGGYEVDDPPEWLRRFASATPFVERDGTFYRLENTFPSYRITAETASAGDVAGEVADYEAYERAVTREEYVASGLLRLARRGGVELNYVWPALEAFLERYDAARYHGDVVSFSVEVADAGPPHVISGTEVSVSEAVDGSVWNANAAPERTRVLVRRAGRADGPYGFDRAPAGLLANLRDHRYVRLDGTFYTTYVEQSRPVPVSVAATASDGRLRLALRNDADAALELSSGAPRPFGVVRCRPTDAADSASPTPARLLWTDAYADSDRVRTDGRDVESVRDVALGTTVGPGESVGEAYAVPADLPPGEYAVEGSLGVTRADTGRTDGETETPDRSETRAEDGESTVRYRVGFSVE